MTRDPSHCYSIAMQKLLHIHTYTPTMEIHACHRVSRPPPTATTGVRGYLRPRPVAAGVPWPVSAAQVCPLAPRAGLALPYAPPSHEHTGSHDPGTREPSNMPGGNGKHMKRPVCHAARHCMLRTVSRASEIRCTRRHVLRCGHTYERE
jgi:hypothetical protein